MTINGSSYFGHFNPLPPRGGRLLISSIGCHRNHFNPLPPRGGRLMQSAYVCFLLYFNPLPPRGGRLVVDDVAVLVQTISIHSLRVEGDSTLLQFFQ